MMDYRSVMRILFAITIMPTLLVLYIWLGPLKFFRHFITFGVLFYAGVFLGIVETPVIGEVPVPPSWMSWAWLALSVAVGLRFPVPDPRRKDKQT